MPIGPLKNLPVFRSSGSTQSGRAQSFSGTSLGRESIKKAKTSMSRAMGESTKISTSIFHPGGASQKASTSVSRSAVIDESLSRGQMSEEERDDLRYNYIRRMTKARQAREEESVKNKKISTGSDKKTQTDISLGTGSGFKTKGKKGVVKQLAKLARNKPLSYKNISKKDSEYFNEVIKPHAKAVGRSSGFGRSTRTSMKQQIEVDRRAGKISSKDASDFKHMIDQLPH